MGPAASPPDSHVHGEVVAGAPRWLILAVVAITVFALGIGVGAKLFDTAAVDGHANTADTMAIGCRNEVVLIVGAEDLPEDTYELRVVVGDRVLPVTHEMTHPIVGRQHPRSVSPVDGRLILIGLIGEPSGRVSYELVGSESDVVEEGPLIPRPLTCIDAQ